MLKLKKLKAEADAKKALETEAAAAGKKVVAKTSAGELILQKEVGDLKDVESEQIVVNFPNPDNLMCCEITIKPDDGFWSGGAFKFTMTMPKTYPHDAPKVHCDTKVYHPNIDLQGKVCLNILREDWKPTLSITAVVLGLQFLFVEPNPGDPLNKNAAQTMKDNEDKFRQNVRQSMRGGRVDGVSFARTLISNKRGYDDYSDWR